MSAVLVLDQPDWAYPGGSCHLRAWQHPDGWIVAILHEPATGNGMSVANAMEGVLDQLADDWTETYGSRPMVVQHTDAGVLGSATWHDVWEVNSRIEWQESSAEDQADSLGITVEALVPEGMSA